MPQTTTRRTVAALTAGLAAMVVPFSFGVAHASGAGDHDGMPTRWERTNGLNPRVDDARRDADEDGLKNIGEYRHDTDPQDADCDEDGLEDGDEVEHGYDPDDADSDDDGVDDGDEDVDDDGVANQDDDDDQGEDADEDESDDDHGDDGSSHDGSDDAGAAQRTAWYAVG